MALSSSLQDAGDGILAERAADGDARAFEVLVRRHAPYMRAFAIRLTGSRADADDAVQEALITAWDRLPTLEKPDRVKSWLLQIVSRKSIDRIRARRPADDIDDHEIADRLTSPSATRRRRRRCARWRLSSMRSPRAARGVDAARGGRLLVRGDRREAGLDALDRARPAVPGPHHRDDEHGGMAMSGTGPGDPGERLPVDPAPALDADGAPLDMAALADYLDRGRTPRIAAYEDDPETRNALRALEHMRDLGRELVQVEAEEQEARRRLLPRRARPHQPRVARRPRHPALPPGSGRPPRAHREPCAPWCARPATRCPASSSAGARSTATSRAPASPCGWSSP